MRKLLIIGSGGHGKVCADIAEKMNRWDEIVFADDNPPAAFPYPIIGGSDVEWDGDYFIGIGNSTIRKKLSVGKNPVTLIHPSAVIGSRVKIGIGTVIMAGAVINPDTLLGDGVIVNTCASVDHDCIVNNYVHVAVGAHLCGTVSVGKCTWVGAGAVISNNLRICNDCVIGAGTVVIHDLTEKGTYIGCPAKKLHTENKDVKLL